MKGYKLAGLGFGAFVVSLSATLAFGQARTPYTRPAYITTTGNISTSANVSASTLSVGTTSTSTRAHFLTEATVYTPSDFSTAHAVFGRNPVSGAGSGGVWLSYHTTDNEGIVGSLSPVVSWRPLSFASSEWKFRQNGATLIANITSTGAFNSVAAAGNQAFSCTNVGCRLSLGNTARYLLDDGTNLEFVAPVQGTSFEALATSGNSFVGGNSSAVMTVSSNTTDAITSTTVPAIRLQASQNIDNNDLLISVDDSAGNRRWTMTELGASVFSGAATFNGSVVTSGGLVTALYIERTPIAVTIPDDGAGTAAAYTWQPAAGRATTHFTCLDANGCDVTMSETGAGNGFQNRAINIGTNTINFADTAGVTELNGAFAMGSYDVLELGYVVDRFVEISRSNN